jgi:PAS domain-containing protein
MRSIRQSDFVGVLAHRRLANRTQKFEEIISQLSQVQQQVEGSQKELQQQKLTLNTAINNMGEGLCMFDAGKRLVVCNDRYAEMYQLPPGMLKVGTSHHEIIKHRIKSGILKGEASDIAANRLISTPGALPTDVTSMSGSSAIAGFRPHRDHRAALPQWAGSLTLMSVRE